MLRQTLIRRRQAGFSLVEMMVAIVAGLIVIGAALAFTVSTVRAYSEHIKSTRFSQELRTGMNLMVRELRRTGYDAASTSRVSTDLNPTEFRNLATPATGCIVYGYDQQQDGTLGNAPADVDKRAIRLSSNKLQVRTSAAADCTGDDTVWSDLTDPRVINITAFAPTVYESPFCEAAPGRDTDGNGTNDTFDVTTGSVTSVSLCLKGALASDSSIVRQITDTVRIRADNLQYASYDTEAKAKAACAAIAAPVAPPTPTDLNEACAAL